MVTRVINIRSKEPYDVYIGNIVRYHPDKYPQTIWGNPWAKELRKYGRDRVLAESNGMRPVHIT
jgi:hypothetical protein